MSSQPRTRRVGPALLIERFAWALGFLCLGTYAVVRFHGTSAARRAVRQLNETREELRTRSPGPSPLSAREPDRSLWSPQRVKAWQESLASASPPPLAVLRIPKIGLEVPVLEGTGEDVLNRGVGHIEGTALPGKPGNLGVAGHRDGFFRGLKDIAPGDRLELVTIDSEETYVIEKTWIVAPEDVSVLEPTASTSVTLVTCYPFYFAGSAPQRFIARAVREPLHY